MTTYLSSAMVTPHDQGTYLVDSGSRDEEAHIVDVVEMTCSCEAFTLGIYKGQPCLHLEEACLQHYDPPQRLLIDSSPLLLLRCRH